MFAVVSEERLPLPLSSPNFMRKGQGGWSQAWESG